MTTTDKLLPCPFCGSVVRLGCDDYSIKASQKYYIECQGIDCLMQDMEDPDRDLLVAAWNRRASQAAPALKICQFCHDYGASSCTCFDEAEMGAAKAAPTEGEA